MQGKDQKDWEQKIATKRSFLKILGTSSIPLYSGITSARRSVGESSRSNSTGVKLENGKLVAVDEAFSTQSNHGQVTSQGTLSAQGENQPVRVSKNQLESALKSLNKLEAENRIRFKKAHQNERANVLIEVVDSPVDDEIDHSTFNGITAQSSHCGNGGKNDFEEKLIGAPPKFNFYLDYNATNEVIEIALYGAGASAAATALLTITGAGSVPAALTGALTAFLSTGAALMSTENEGDGVILRVNYVPPSPWVEVDSQCHGDGGIPW